MNIGSFWHKWDLHIHTPTSYDYKNKSITNEIFIDTLIKREVRVIAITDHHIIDVDRIRDLQKIGQDKITILPGIEFLSDAKGREPIHFIGIFSEKCDLDYIWGQIENCTKIKEIKNGTRDFNQVYCNIEETTKLIKELGGIVSIHAGDKSNSIENITHSLPHGQAQKTDIAKSIHIYELGKEKDQKGYKEIVFPAIKKVIPMIICSDNHNINSYVVKQNLWIKAEPTFEGLKQIIHAPKTRVKILENRPLPPVNRIDLLTIKFPENTTIIRAEDKKDSSKAANFCFSGEHKISFNPYFTCLIGGRGSGKSTILNLIAQKLLGKSSFFDDNILKDKKKALSIDSFIKIEGSTHEIEFISQNEVEKFASSGEITEAIYDRLTHKKYDDFRFLEEKMQEHINLIDEQIKYINTYSQEEEELQRLKNQLSDSKKIIASLDSVEYKEINNEINIIVTQIQSIRKQKEDYEQLINAIKSISKTNSFIDSPQTIYEREINNIISALNSIINTQKNLTQGENELLELEGKLNVSNNKLDAYLKNQGVSAENISDYERANSLIPLLQIKIEDSISNLERLKLKIENFVQVKIDINNAKESYESAIVGALAPLNVQLKNINSEVEDIEFKYEFDSDEALNQLFDEFETHFKDYKPSEHRTRFDAVREYLLCINPEDVDGYDEYMTKLEERGSAVKAKEYIKLIFDKKVNFETYKLLIMKVYKDAYKFKKIKGLYGNKELKSCSFGQRCTAVIVALVMFGNKPLIIDEPEAHLDSKLIAEYLVNLIKERKHDRQIIFATHNANFVVNGDAELINILEVNKETNITSITPCTIESLEHRDKLLNLEGGKEAFKKREKRLIV